MLAPEVGVSADGFRAASQEDARPGVQDWGSGHWDNERQCYIISAGTRCAQQPWQSAVSDLCADGHGCKAVH